MPNTKYQYHDIQGVHNILRSEIENIRKRNEVIDELPMLVSFEQYIKYYAVKNLILNCHFIRQYLLNLCTSLSEELDVKSNSTQEVIEKSQKKKTQYNYNIESIEYKKLHFLEELAKKYNFIHDFDSENKSENAQQAFKKIEKNLQDLEEGRNYKTLDNFYVLKNNLNPEWEVILQYISDCDYFDQTKHPETLNLEDLLDQEGNLIDNFEQKLNKPLKFIYNREKRVIDLSQINFQSKKQILDALIKIKNSPEQYQIPEYIKICVTDSDGVEHDKLYHIKEGFNKELLGNLLAIDKNKSTSLGLDNIFYVKNKNKTSQKIFKFDDEAFAIILNNNSLKLAKQKVPTDPTKLSQDKIVESSKNLQKNLNRARVHGEEQASFYQVIEDIRNLLEQNKVSFEGKIKENLGNLQAKIDVHDSSKYFFEHSNKECQNPEELMDFIEESLAHKIFKDFIKHHNKQDESLQPRLENERRLLQHNLELSESLCTSTMGAALTEKRKDNLTPAATTQEEATKENLLSAASTSENSGSDTRTQTHFSNKSNVIEIFERCHEELQKTNENFRELKLSQGFDINSLKQNFACSLFVLSDTNKAGDNQLIFLNREYNSFQLPLCFARRGKDESAMSLAENYFQAGAINENISKIIYTHSERVILIRIKKFDDNLYKEILDNAARKENPNLTFALYTELPPCITCQKDIKTSLHSFHQKLIEKLKQDGHKEISLEISISYSKADYQDRLKNTYDSLLQDQSVKEDLESLIVNKDELKTSYLELSNELKTNVLYQLLEGGFLRLEVKRLENDNEVSDGNVKYKVEKDQITNYAKEWFKQYKDSINKVKSVIESQKIADHFTILEFGKNLDVSQETTPIGVSYGRSGDNLETFNTPEKQQGTKSISSQQTPNSVAGAPVARAAATNGNDTFAKRTLRFSLDAVNKTSLKAK